MAKKYAIQQRYYHVGEGWSEWSIDFDRTFDDRELAEQAIEDDNLSDTAQYRVVEIASSEISVPRWFLTSIENTLRIQNNLNSSKPECCQSRNIKGALNGVRKLLKGEELTGMERLETLTF